MSKLAKEITEQRGVFKLRATRVKDYNAQVFRPEEKPWPPRIVQNNSEGVMYDNYYIFCGVGNTQPIRKGDIVLTDDRGNVMDILFKNGLYGEYLNYSGETYELIRE